MAENQIIETQKKLTELKNKTDIKVWQYAVLREFIDLFGQDRRVLNFIATKYNATLYGLIDDSILLSKEELALYEAGKEPRLEDELEALLEIKKS